MAVSKYDQIEKNIKKIAKWVSEGLFEYQIFTKLGISKPTWEKYKKEKPELREALEKGQEKRNFNLIPKLENALIKRALGYEEEQVEETSERSPEGKITVKKKIIKKQVPPDVGAAHILLKNFNRPKGTRWTDNPEGDEIKRQKLELEKQALEAKQNGFWQ